MTEQSLKKIYSKISLQIKKIQGHADCSNALSPLSIENNLFRYKEDFSNKLFLLKSQGQN